MRTKSLKLSACIFLAGVALSTRPAVAQNPKKYLHNKETEKVSKYTRPSIACS
jgi:hypothetical protein